MKGRGETARGLVHLLAGACALTLKWLTVPEAALIAALAIVFNFLILPRIGGQTLFRKGERQRPLDSGIHLYPIAVLLLILIFGRRMEVVAAAWLIMAAGDPAARWVGRAFGRRPLAWNPSKSIAGSMACAAAASLACWSALVWMGGAPGVAALLAIPTGLFAAFVESLPWRLNDNLTVPLLSGLFLCGLEAGQAARIVAVLPGLRPAFLVALIVNLIIAIAFRNAGMVDRSGMVAGFAVGLLTWTFAGWQAFAILFTFFVLGSGATQLGRRRKERLGVAQPRRGARSARHALANCGVAVYLAALAATDPAPGLWLLALVCAYATASFDTVSSEIGQAWGGRPVLITTLRPVPIGTDGGVSLTGTSAGFAAAALVAALGVALGIVPLRSIPVVLVAAFVGSTADSYLGATLERKGLMDNEAVNFSNTLIGALAGIGGALLGGAL
jgi:uncharacterized protein (TIGR00297 family)